MLNMTLHHIKSDHIAHSIVSKYIHIGTFVKYSDSKMQQRILVI